MANSITFTSVTTYSHTHTYKFTEREYEMMRTYYKYGKTLVEQGTWDFLKHLTFDEFLKFFDEREYYRKEEGFDVKCEDAYGNILDYNVFDEIEDYIAGWAESNSPDDKTCESWTEDFTVNKR